VISVVIEINLPHHHVPTPQTQTATTHLCKEEGHGMMVENVAVAQREMEELFGWDDTVSQERRP
jgi:hypothetical protein